MVCDNEDKAQESIDGKLLPINALAPLHSGDANTTRAYIQDIFYSAAKESCLPLPEYIFGLQHLMGVFYERARADKQQFVPWLYLDDVLTDIFDSLRQGLLIRPLGFADTVMFEQAWDPMQRPRMAVFKPLIEAIYGAAHAVHQHRTGSLSAYSQLHERLEDYLDVASSAAVLLRENVGKMQETPVPASKGIIIVPDAKALFYTTS